MINIDKLTRKMIITVNEYEKKIMAMTSNLLGMASNLA